MDPSQPHRPAPAALPDDAGPVTLLVTAWLSTGRSQNTRAAYARDIGVTPPRRPSRAPSWLAWCQQQAVHPVTGVTALHVIRYARHLDKAGLSPATAARKLAAISSWYAWLARRGHITASPAAGLARPRPGPQPPPAPPLTPDQALALIHAADTAPGPHRARTAALTALLLLTSARLTELTSASPADLGTSSGHRVLWVTRAGRRQALPLPRPAASRIDAYLASRPAQDGQDGSPALFTTRTGRPLHPADIRRILHRLATQAGLPPDQARHLGPRMIRRSLTTPHPHSYEPPRTPHTSAAHPSRHPTSRHHQDRTPDLGPRPQGRPHCHARRPHRTAGGQTQPPLSPRVLIRSYCDSS